MAELGNSKIFGDLDVSRSLHGGNFISGFAGNGWRIDQNLTSEGKSYAEFDDLTIRGSLRVYELLINQLRATNGSVFVSSIGKVLSVSGTTLYFDSENGAGHGFQEGDIIRAQRWDSDSNEMLVSDLEVTGTSGQESITYTKINGDDPEPGYEYVRLGSSSNSNRRGSVYMTADDSGAPFIDVVDGVSSHSDWDGGNNVKARFGNLSGISGASGYGLWSENVYLTGVINAESGKIAGWSIAGNDLIAENGRLRTSTSTTRMEIDSSGINGYNSGSKTFNLSSDGSGWFGASDKLSWSDSGVLKAGHWTIEDGYIRSNATGSSYLTLTSADGSSPSHHSAGFTLYRYNSDLDSSKDIKLVSIGRLRDKNTINSFSDDYGLEVLRGNSSSNYRHVIRMGGVESIIAGWEIDENTISSGGVNLQSGVGSNNKIYIGSGSYDSSNTPFYVDGDGRFSLSDKLKFSDGDLEIKGNMTAGNITGVDIEGSTFKSFGTYNNVLTIRNGNIEETYSFSNALGDEEGKYTLSRNGFYNYKEWEDEGLGEYSQFKSEANLTEDSLEFSYHRLGMGSVKYGLRKEGVTFFSSGGGMHGSHYRFGLTNHSPDFGLQWTSLYSDDDLIVDSPVFDIESDNIFLRGETVIEGYTIIADDLQVDDIDAENGYFDKIGINTSSPDCRLEAVQSGSSPAIHGRNTWNNTSGLAGVKGSGGSNVGEGYLGAMLDGQRAGVIGIAGDHSSSLAAQFLGEVHIDGALTLGRPSGDEYNRPTIMGGESDSRVRIFTNTNSVNSYCFLELWGDDQLIPERRGEMTFGGQSFHWRLESSDDDSGSEKMIFDDSGLSVDKNKEIGLSDRFLAFNSWSSAPVIYYDRDHGSNYDLRFRSHSSDGNYRTDLGLVDRGMRVFGDLNVDGDKNVVQNTKSYGKRLMNALETPDSRFVAYLEKELPEGENWIEIEPMFLETISDYFIVPHVQNASDIVILERRKGKFRVWVYGHKAEVVFEINGKRKGKEHVYMRELQYDDDNENESIEQ